jgi:hypothetical protein
MKLEDAIHDLVWERLETQMPFSLGKPKRRQVSIGKERF